MDQTYKIVLVGDAGVGKTSFIRRFKTGEFVKKYNETVGVDKTIISFDTNHGKIQFDIWDTAGQEKFNGLFDSYYEGAHGIIAMFSTDSRISYRSVHNIVNDIPIGIYGNKCEMPNIKCNIPIEERSLKYNIISVKTCVNLDMPFLYLARQITGHDDLVFIEEYF